jgi:NAD(P)H dehydrogenase (quinone)
LIVVGLPFKGQMSVTQAHGGTPYGATTITGSDGLRMPSAVEIEAARFQGRHVAVIAEGCGRVRTRDMAASAVAAV